MTDSTPIFVSEHEHLTVHTDRPEGPVRGRCLIVPPYGMPAAVLDFVANSLTARGFETVRLDPRDHAGEGSGEMIDFRMSSLAADVAIAIEHLEPTCVAALSMGARAAVRALRNTASPAAAILLIPVVDPRSTIETIVGFDWFAIPDEELPQSAPVLGIEINASRFLRDSEMYGLIDPADTFADVAATRGPLTLVPGTDDPWVRFGDVVSLANTDPRRIQLRPVECDRHRFDEDPELALQFVDVLIDEVDRVHGYRSPAA